MQDWMKAVRSPIRYRVGGSRFKFVFPINKLVCCMAVSALFCLCILYYFLSGSNNSNRVPIKSLVDLSDDVNVGLHESSPRGLVKVAYELYNDGVISESKTRVFELLAVADLDTSSKKSASSSDYISYLLRGKLTLHGGNNGGDGVDVRRAEIDFEAEPSELSAEYSFGGRGMELSELVVFNGKLYACDDRTGIVYEVLLSPSSPPRVTPWVILVDGDGKNTSKGFKCEWMAVKERKLYVGGLGKEWTTPKGVLVNHNPQWVKVVGHLGDVAHVDWTNKYNFLRSKGGYSFPGYMIFESAAWSPHEQKWYFLPRRASQESYDEKADEKRATNLLIKTDEEFTQVDYHTIGEIIPVRGYSSFKFVPGTQSRLIIALKSEEDDGRLRTYVTLFDVNGLILIHDKLISDKLKYEGIEFV